MRKNLYSLTFLVAALAGSAFAGPATQPSNESIIGYIKGYADGTAGLPPAYTPASTQPAVVKVTPPPPATQPATSPSTAVVSIPTPIAPAPPAYPYPLDADGWLVLKPSATSKQIYASNSTGTDTNAGDEAHPVKTIAAAMKLIRPGQPDWIYLKMGDEFNETISGNIGGSGPSAHAVITSYGTGDRPKITVAGQSSLLLYGNYIAVIDVEFNPNGRDPATPNFKLVTTGGGCNFRGHHIIFEGNRCLYGAGSNLDVEPNVTTANPAPTPLPGVFIRRNVIAYAYSGGTGFSQGIHTDGLDTPFIEENFIHQNGWNPKVKLGTNSMFNHGLYNSWNFGAKSAYIRWNVFSNNCSSGVQQRSGGTFHNNFLLNNGTAEDWTGEGDSLFVDLNVSTTSLDCPTAIGPGSTSFYAGGGFLFNGSSGKVLDNIVCHGKASAGFPAFQLARNAGDKADPSKAGPIEFGGNVVYDYYFDGFDYTDAEHLPLVSFHDNATALCRRKYLNMRPSPTAPATALTGKITLANNLYDADNQFWWQNASMSLAGWSAKMKSTGEKIGAITYVDPSRTIEGYIVTQKMGKNYQDFVNLSLALRKGNYDKMLVAYSVNQYFQQGFTAKP